MGDNAPFLGMANISYYNRIARGQITAVHYDLIVQSVENKQPVLCQQTYRTVDVRLLEGKPSVIANVKLPELVSFLGYGLNYLPSIGDLVIVGFSPTNDAQILNILSRSPAFEHGSLYDTGEVELNSYGDPVIDSVIMETIRPTPIRKIQEGEISLTSLNANSELYFDKYGTAKLISRIPVLNKKGNEYVNGLQCGNRLWEISVGQDIINEGTKEIKQSSFGNNIQFQILGHQNDCKVDFDSEGNIEINNKECNLTINKDGVINISIKSGEKIQINKNNISLGDGVTDKAVLGNVLYDLLSELIITFNEHVHIGNFGYPTSSPMATVEMKDILSKIVELK